MPTDPIEREKKIRELLMDREKMLREYITSPEDPEKLLWYARAALSLNSEQVYLDSKGLVT